MEGYDCLFLNFAGFGVAVGRTKHRPQGVLNNYHMYICFWGLSSDRRLVAYGFRSLFLILKFWLHINLLVLNPLVCSLLHIFV